MIRNFGGTLIALLVVATAALYGPTLAHYRMPASSGRPSPRASHPGACQDQYLDGVAPAYLRQGLDRRTTTICYQAFSIGYSGLTRTPLWSAEHLTRDTVDAAHLLTRVNVFHPDPHLAEPDRATLADYRGSGFDRGHMAPSADMPTAAAQAESFSLANMVPQTRELNRHQWSAIEQAVRQLARDDDRLYVVTGPVFAGSDLESLDGRVAVPTSTYKAVYVPGLGAAAYVATNSDRPRLQIVSIADLRATIGIDPFPGLDEATKAHAIAIPYAGNHHRRSHESPAP